MNELEQSTKVWVVVPLDRNGNSQGFEKAGGRFYLTLEDALAALRKAISNYDDLYIVAEALIGYT